MRYSENLGDGRVRANLDHGFLTLSDTQYPDTGPQSDPIEVSIALSPRQWRALLIYLRKCEAEAQAFTKELK